jgi:hypothetical protein
MSELVDIRMARARRALAAFGRLPGRPRAQVLYGSVRHPPPEQRLRVEDARALAAVGWAIVTYPSSDGRFVCALTRAGEAERDRLAGD